MDAAISGLLEFVGRHADLAPLFALLFATGETLAFLSFLIPSTPILLGMGALASSGALALWPMTVGAAIGATLGSTASWWLGRTYGDAILRLWPLRNHPDLVDRARATFGRWGVIAVLAGHFIGPLRPVVFLLAGLSRIAFWRFQMVNLPGAVLWAWLVPQLGVIGGDAIGWVWRTLGF